MLIVGNLVAPTAGSTHDLLPPKQPREHTSRLLPMRESARHVTSSNRESIRKAILALGPVAEGDVALLAIQLSSKFPQSGMTIQMIEEEIRRSIAPGAAATDRLAGAERAGEADRPSEA